MVELRENPKLLAPRSYDLRLLQAIHRHLFQDVYDWADDVRTVGIEKGDESFCPPGSIVQPMDHTTADRRRRRGAAQPTELLIGVDSPSVMASSARGRPPVSV